MPKKKNNMVSLEESLWLQFIENRVSIMFAVFTINTSMAA